MIKKSLFNFYIVTFPIAKKLKELGFDWKCLGMYGEDGSLFSSVTVPGMNYNEREGCYSCPTLEEAARWLREKSCQVYVVPYKDFPEEAWKYVINFGTNKWMSADSPYDSYEEALLYGIGKCVHSLGLKQPEWCDYPNDELGNAATPVLGCWSLLEGNIHKPEDCLECTGEMCKCFNENWKKRKKEEKKRKILSFL